MSSSVEGTQNNNNTVIQLEKNDLTETEEFRKWTSKLQAVQIASIEKYAPLNELTLEGKKYTRSKITGKIIKALSDLKEKGNNEYAYHQKFMELYFGVPEEDFDNLDYEEIKQIVYAHDVRTERGFR